MCKLSLCILQFKISLSCPSYICAFPCPLSLCSFMSSVFLCTFVHNVPLSIFPPKVSLITSVHLDVRRRLFFLPRNILYIIIAFYKLLWLLTWSKYFSCRDILTAMIQFSSKCRSCRSIFIFLNHIILEMFSATLEFVNFYCLLCWLWNDGLCSHQYVALQKWKLILFFPYCNLSPFDGVVPIPPPPPTPTPKPFPMHLNPAMFP